MTRTGALVISLDFELYWGTRGTRTLQSAAGQLAATRQVIPRILRLFEQHAIHATWATVGLVMCESRAEARAHAPAAPPSYVDSRLSPYPDLDQLGDDERARPLLFAPDLVRAILATPHQELGTHTFSHYYCLEQNQSAEAFRQDLDAVARLAGTKFGVAPSSLVFPRNQVDPASLRAAADAGIVAYRGTEEAWFYRARSRTGESLLQRSFRLADAYLPLSGDNTFALDAADGVPVNVPSSRFLRPYSRRLRRLEPLRLRRIRSALRFAAEKKRAYHLWWHPENFAQDPDANLGFLADVLRAFESLREGHGMRSLTMGEAARERRPRPTATSQDFRPAASR